MLTLVLTLATVPVSLRQLHAIPLASAKWESVVHGDGLSHLYLHTYINWCVFIMKKTKLHSIKRFWLHSFDFRQLTFRVVLILLRLLHYHSRHFSMPVAVAHVQLCTPRSGGGFSCLFYFILRNYSVFYFGNKPPGISERMFYVLTRVNSFPPLHYMALETSAETLMTFSLAGSFSAWSVVYVWMCCPAPPEIKATIPISPISLACQTPLSHTN